MTRPVALITRPWSQALVTAEKIREQGHYTPLVVPLLEIVPVEWCPPSSPPHGLVLTSRNAVAALGSFARHTPVYAVGEATAEAARKAGFNHVEAAEGEAHSLIRLIRARVNPGPETRLLHLSGEDIAVDLAAALGGEGFCLTRVVVYKAAALATPFPPEALRAAVALLYSPRTAAIFARRFPHRDIALACLSAAVAEAAGPGWHSCTLAPDLSENGLLHTLATQPTASLRT